MRHNGSAGTQRTQMGHGWPWEKRDSWVVYIYIIYIYVYIYMYIYIYVDGDFLVTDVWLVKVNIVVNSG